MTEKNYNPQQKERASMKKQEKVEKMKETANAPKKIEEKKKVEGAEKEEHKKPDTKTPVKEKPKKTEAVVNIENLPISTLHSIAVCRFIKGKEIAKAINDLEEVLKFKKAIPMKGEIPHRKGRIMSGKYPKKAAENFIKVLKNLQANANVNGINQPVIVEAVSNIASRPFGRFGRVRRKRTHVKIKVKEKKNGRKNENSEKKIRKVS